MASPGGQEGGEGGGGGGGGAADGGREGRRQWQGLIDGKRVVGGAGGEREGGRETLSSESRHTPPSVGEEGEEDEGRWGGVQDKDEVFFRLNEGEGRLSIATWREGGREALFSLPLPPAQVGREGGEEEGERRWHFCVYLSNGVGVDLLPVTEWKMREVFG
jgi:hypothetical protein